MIFPNENKKNGNINRKAKKYLRRVASAGSMVCIIKLVSTNEVPAIKDAKAAAICARKKEGTFGVDIKSIFPKLILKWDYYLILKHILISKKSFLG